MCSSSTPVRSPAAGTGSLSCGQGTTRRERPRASGLPSGSRGEMPQCRAPAPSTAPPRYAASGADSAAPDLWRQLRSRLSPNARLILRVLHEDGAAFVRLIRACGGQALRIPRRLPPPDHELRRQLGADMLQRLMATFGGTVVYVPRCRFLLAAVQRRQIIRRYYRYTGSGRSGAAAVRALAREERLSDRRIRQILKTSDDLPPGAEALPDLLDT